MFLDFRRGINTSTQGRSVRLLSGDTLVSYTHLDVYKRQELYKVVTVIKAKISAAVIVLGQETIAYMDDVNIIRRSVRIRGESCQILKEDTVLVQLH